MNQLLNGIREKLFVLPDDVRVIPGHGGFSTIGGRKKNESIFSIELYEKDRNNCGHDVRIWTGEIIIGTDKRRTCSRTSFHGRTHRERGSCFG